MALFSRDDVKGLTLLLPILLVLALLVLLYGKMQQSDVVDEMKSEEAEVERRYAPFNPNTFSYEELRRAGVDAAIAVGIVRWREYGKVYPQKINPESPCVFKKNFALSHIKKYPSSARLDIKRQTVLRKDMLFFRPVFYKRDYLHFSVSLLIIKL